MKITPTFAVIGRVNKGKSSIVSALAEDDGVIIESSAGTTRECQDFPVLVDGRTIIMLIDTPGFQQAPRALARMKESEISAASGREDDNEFYKLFKITSSILSGFS